MTKELLRIEGLNAWYGESHILHGVDLTGTRKGSIRINGEEAIKLPPHKVARLGVGYCPEERGIFASLTAEENLMLPPVIADGGMSVAEIYEMFPNLRERAGSQGTRLSGG